MARRFLTCAGVLFAVLTIMWALPAASAEDLGKMRVQRTDGRWFEGEVEEKADRYLIKQGRGIVITLLKSEVKVLEPLGEARPAESADLDNPAEDSTLSRRRITDQEIEALLEGIQIETAADADSTKIPDELPTDEESVEEMKFLAGTDKVLETPHIVMVYTSNEAEANRLLRRLESVWRWNIKFFRMMEVPVQVPEYKLEVYFFGTNEEFETHSVNTSGRRSGAGGYFSPTSNRSHFFDMISYPFIQARLELAKDTNRPLKERRRHENIVKRWAESMNTTVVQHEIGHHIHFNLGLFPMDVFVAAFEERGIPDPFPRWLVEGTTMMFEVPPTTAGASLGVVNHGQLDKFRKHYVQRKFSPQWLKSFVVDNSVWHRGGGGSYPIGWALVYYLRKQHPEGFAEYYKIMTAREPGDRVDMNQREKEFIDCFGEIDEEWIDKWYDFIKNLRLKKSLLPPDIFAP